MVILSPTSPIIDVSHAGCPLVFFFFLFTYTKGWYSGLVALCCKGEASPLLASPFRLPEINAEIFMVQWQEGV